MILLEELTEKTNFDFISFVERYNSFYEDNFFKLVSFWKNLNGNLDFSILEEFDWLKNNFLILIDTFKKHSNGAIIDLEYFDLLEYFEKIRSSLELIDNLPKWLKTSTNKVDVFEEPVFIYFVEQGDTPEKISKKFYGDEELFDNVMNYNGLRYTDVNAVDWVGRELKIPLKRISNKDVQGIIDGLVGENILGKDIKKSFTLLDDDIVTITGINCVKEAVLTLIGEVHTDSIPEFRDINNFTNEIIGKNFGDISIPMISNEFYSLLKLEPTIEKTTITKIEKESDAIIFNFNFELINGADYSSRFFIRT